jgi:regulator of replication initiation timing
MGNDSKYMENTENQYVLDLIYESIKLMEENIRLYMENKKLRERVFKLEKIIGTGSNLISMDDDYIGAYFGKASGRYKN